MLARSRASCKQRDVWGVDGNVRMFFFYRDRQYLIVVYVSAQRNENTTSVASQVRCFHVIYILRGNRSD
jgi:hypothetical protein